MNDWNNLSDMLRTQCLTNCLVYITVGEYLMH